jgi:lysophospholipase L1-like esterase
MLRGILTATKDHYAEQEAGMKLRRLGRCATVVIVSIAVLLTGLSAASANPPEHTYYVALGDSLSKGFMPPGGDSDEGYVDQLYKQLQPNHPGLELVKLGCSGESTTTMRQGGICSYPGAASQLAAAVAFLRAHRGAVRYLTIDIGANDIDPCAASGVIDQACVQNGLRTIAGNLLVILAALRAAGGFGPQYAGMTYYDPFLAAWLQGPAGQAVARQSVQISNVLNALETIEYQVFGMKVADVSGAFQTNNFTEVPVGSGTLPINVATICTLTFMCRPPAPPNIHPNVQGYAVIANAFEAVLR